VDPERTPTERTPIMSDPVPLTYRELAERLGLSPDSARIKAKRRKWQTIPGNHPSDPVRVLVPVEFLNRERKPGERAPSAPPESSGEIKALEAHVQTMRELLEDRNAAHAAEVARLIDDGTRLQDQLQEARAEADHAKSDQVHMARDVSIMFDELKALADRHADRARLQAELEQARAELARARRPWWRRLMRHGG